MTFFEVGARLGELVGGLDGVGGVRLDFGDGVGLTGALATRLRVRQARPMTFGLNLVGIKALDRIDPQRAIVIRVVVYLLLLLVLLFLRLVELAVAVDFHHIH